MSDFKFKGSEVKIEENTSNNTGVQYGKPGIHELHFTTMTYKVAGTGAAYMDCEAKNSQGEVVTRQYYLTQDVKPGKQKSAFSITADSLKKLSIAIGKEKEYDVAECNSAEEFVTKMSAIFIGKWFRNKVKGKEIEKRDGGRFMKSEMSDAFESITVPASSSRLKFNEQYDLKYLPAKENITTNTPQEADTSDLPF